MKEKQGANREGTNVSGRNRHVKSALWGPSFQPDPLPCRPSRSVRNSHCLKPTPVAVPDIALMAPPAEPSS